MERADWDERAELVYEMGREKLYALCDFNCKVKDNTRIVVPIYDDAKGEPENDEVIKLHDRRDINTTVWDVITWYFSPEPERSPNLSTAKQDRDFARDFQDNKRLCADAVPFIGQALSTQYARMISSGAYIGFADTGLFCNSPLALPAFFDKPMADEDYHCPVEKMPVDLPDWNRKFYSPLCRPWFQEQRKNPKQNTLSDIYAFADSKRFGLTPCAPILK